AGGGYVEYPHLRTLAVDHGRSSVKLRRFEFDGTVPFPSLQRLISGIECPFGDDMMLFRGNAATLELLKLTLTHELAVSLLRHNVFTPTSHPKLQHVMLRLPGSMKPASDADNPEIIQLMRTIAPDAVVREISHWSLNQAPLSLMLSLLSKHTSLQVLALSDVRLSIWDAMTLIKSLPLLSDLHAKSPTLDPMPEGVTKSTIVKYVTSNYSPMAMRFRCWHLQYGGVGGVIPFLLLALACTSFDYVAIGGCRRKRFEKLLENTIDMVTYREHAPRLRRLLPHVSE
ncbi:hypothetical protein GGI13_001240, partial [Coemansia sp. RSA 455]